MNRPEFRFHRADQSTTGRELLSFYGFSDGWLATVATTATGMLTAFPNWRQDLSAQLPYPVPEVRP
jgi:hypothetical protein